MNDTDEKSEEERQINVDIRKLLTRRHEILQIQNGKHSNASNRSTHVRLRNAFIVGHCCCFHCALPLASHTLAQVKSSQVHSHGYIRFCRI